MDFKAFRGEIAKQQSAKWSSRQRLLDAYERALYGELYAHKAVPFSQELRDPSRPNSERIRLDERRAALQFRLPWIITRDIVGRLWGEAHRPNIVVKGDDDITSAWIAAFLHDTRFWLTLIEASWEGAVGSVAVVLRVLGDSDIVDGVRKPRGPGRFYAEAWPSKECSPVFDRNRPGELSRLPRTWVVDADALRADGYDVEALDLEWRNKKFGSSARGRAWTAQWKREGAESWVLRVLLDKTSETWYKPVPQWMYERDDFRDADFVVDADRSFTHGLGEVPARWGRPIPLRHSRFPDGLCLFEPVIDYQFRIDRTLSQTGRAFDYAGDPQMAIVEGGGDGGSAFGDDDIEPSASPTDIIPVPERGGAEFVEISGDGLRVAIETYVKLLVQLAREVGSASRIDHDAKVGSTLSGVAMKLLDAALDTLVGILHITLGEHLFVDLLRLAMRISQKVDVDLPSLQARLREAKATGGDPDPNAVIELPWPDACPPTGQDLLYTVQAIIAALEKGLITHETAVANAAPYFDVQNANAEAESVLAQAPALHELLNPSDSGSGDSGATPTKDATST